MMNKELAFATWTAPRALSANVVHDIVGALSSHRHVPGPQFTGLSFVVDDQGDQIFAVTDALAERVRKSGCATLLSVGHIARFPRILAYLELKSSHPF